MYDIAYCQLIVLLYCLTFNLFYLAVVHLTKIIFIYCSHLTSYTQDDGLSEYERLRLERIARNQARLRQLGFDEPKEGKKKKKKPPAKPRKSELADGPRRQLPGRAKRATFNESSFVAAAKKERREEEEKNMDACYTCQKEEGGE